jgi:hypothetical protein
MRRCGPSSKYQQGKDRRDKWRPSERYFQIVMYLIFAFRVLPRLLIIDKEEIKMLRCAWTGLSPP